MIQNVATHLALPVAAHIKLKSRMFAYKVVSASAPIYLNVLIWTWYVHSYGKLQELSPKYSGDT